jgi:WD40 repeat protein
MVFALLGLTGWLVVRDLAAEEPAAAKAADRPDAAADSARPGMDPFGDPLPAYARLRLGTVRFRQGSAITMLRYLPDGKTLVSAGSDQVIRFWEASTGKERYRFGTPFGNATASVLGLLVAPDADIAFAAAGVRALSPDGKRVATLETDQTIKLWDPATGKEVGQLGKPLTNNASRNLPVFSHNGKVLAVAEYDGLGGSAILVFDVATGKETRLTAPEPKDEGQPGFQLQTLALSPDGKTVISLGNESGVANKLRLWEVGAAKAVEVQDGANLNPNNGQAFVGTAAAPDQGLLFTPDGKQFGLIATTTNRESGANVFSLRLWDAGTGKKLRDIGGHPENIAGAYFSRDGAAVALVLNNQSVKVHDLTTGKEQYALAAAVNTAVMTVAFAPDGRTLAVGCGDNSIQLYDTAKGELRHNVKGTDNKGATAGYYYPLMVAFSTDSKTLAAAAGSMIRLWDVASGKETHPVRAGHEGTLNALAVAANGKLVATASGDNTVRLWDPASGKQLRLITGPTADGQALINAFGIVPPNDVRVVISNDSRLLGIGWTDGSIDLWDVQAGQRLHQLKAHQLPIMSLAFAPNGKTLASGALDGRALWWDVGTGKMLRVVAGRPLADDGAELPPGLAGTGFDATLIAMAPDGRTLAVASQDIGGPAIGLYETATFQLRRKLRFKSEAANAQLALLGAGNAVSPFMGSGLSGLGTLRFTPDGKGLLWTSGTTTRLVDLAKGKEIRRFGGQDDAVNGIAVSPDGKLLAGAGGDGTVQFWDVASGTVLGALTGHRGPVSTIAFTPDGQAVITGGADTTALVWDVPRFLEDTRLAPKELVDERLATLWKTLGSENAQEAFEALHQIRDVPKQAIALLRARVKPAPPTNPERIARLVADLESDRFEVRKFATLSLEKMGELTEPALRKRLADSPPLEVRQRLEHLLEKLAGPITDAERLRAHRSLEILEHIGTPEAKAVLQTLARGAPEARLTQEAKEALERLK